MTAFTPDPHYLLSNLLGKFRPRVVAALLDANLDGTRSETIYGKQAHLAIPFYMSPAKIATPGPNGTQTQTGES